LIVLREEHDRARTMTVTDLGKPSKIVGIEITHDRAQKKITITQTNYIDVILIKYGLQDASPVHTPLDPNIKNYNLVNQKPEIEATIMCH